MISGSCGAATIRERVFIGMLPISAGHFRGLSYRVKRFSISHDSSTHIVGDQRIFQV